MLMRVHAQRFRGCMLVLCACTLVHVIKPAPETYICAQTHASMHITQTHRSAQMHSHIHVCAC